MGDKYSLLLVQQASLHDCPGWDKRTLTDDSGGQISGFGEQKSWCWM